jgi:hypothetical protein
MDKEEKRQSGSHTGNREHALRRAVAHLCRSNPSFRAQSSDERIRFLQGLGLPVGAAQEVAALFELTYEGASGSFDVNLDPCEIRWRVSVAAPVFYGYEDMHNPEYQNTERSAFDTEAKIPTQMRVFYPSLSGTPEHAPILRGCGPYGLVVFVHGICEQASAEHYKHWYHLPQQIARCGYVVVVPQLGLTDLNGDASLNLVERVVNWMRTRSPYRFDLALPPNTAVIGHSYGAIVGARLATRIPVSAYISLSGVWLEVVSVTYPWPNPLPELNVPALFTWGTGDDFDARLDGGTQSVFESVALPRHKVAFGGAGHYDYIAEEFRHSCGGTSGPCDLVMLLASDLCALFLSRYMSTKESDTAAGILPSLQFRDPIHHTPEQNFYSGLHLLGLSSIAGSPSCGLTHSWFLKDGETGELTLP